MKRNDSGAFSIFYLEADDTREALFTALAGLHKPAVLLLSEQTRLFQHPEEFIALRHLRRQVDIAVYFIIAHSDHLVSLTERCGFPVYTSIDALSEALQPGNTPRQRVLVRTDGNAPRSGPVSPLGPRRTVPLSPRNDISLNDTAQLPALATLAPPTTPTGNRAGRTTDPLTPRSMPAVTAQPARIRTTDSLTSQVQGMVGTEIYPAQPVGTASSRSPLSVDTSGARGRDISASPVEMTNVGTGKGITSTAIDELPTRPPVARPKTPKQRNRWSAVLISLMILALSSAGLASLLVFYHPPATLPAAPQVIGYVSFLSSGQFNGQTNQGLDDEVKVNLTQLASLAAGKSYYAWLLGDKDMEEAKVIPLGMLSVKNGSASLFYITPAHTNLLATFSRFLVTEEDTTPPPIGPAPNPSTWRYYGAFLQKPVPFTGVIPGVPAQSGSTPQYSYLDHLRDLLADDPMLDTNQLPGGLNVWLYQNTGKILAWATSMRSAWADNHDMNAVSNQALLALTYLDGLSYIVQDLPPGTPLSINDRQARIGLLNIKGPEQDPPDYLDSVVAHLNGLLQAAGSTPALRQQVGALIATLNNVRYRLQKVRADAQQIVNMNAQQLTQSATLNIINDMIANATDAYTGWFDPSTGKWQPGVTWLYSHVQALATIAITVYSASSSQINYSEAML